MSNLIPIYEECPRCGFHPSHGHSPLCVYKGKQTNLTHEQIEAFDRYLIATGAKIVFPDGQRFWVKLQGAPDDAED